MSKKTKKVKSKATAKIKGGFGNWNGGPSDRSSNPRSPIGNPNYDPAKDPTLTGTPIGPSYSDRARGNGGFGGGSGSSSGSGGKRSSSGKGSTV